MTVPTTARAGRTLAYAAEESPALALRLAGELGYEPAVSSLARMSGPDAGLATVRVAADVDLLVRVGDVKQPHTALLRALADADGAVRLVAAVHIESPWVWASARSTPGSAVRVCRRGYADVSRLPSLAGFDWEIIDDPSPVSVITAGTEDGSRSVIVDRDERPHHLSFLHELPDAPSLTFGLISRLPADEETSYSWLSLTPDTEAVGTLASALGVIAGCGIDLDFLQSDALPTGGHRFFLGFGGDSATTDRVVARLAESGTAATVLAAFQGERV